MNDLEPIELEILMNSTAVAAQSERVRNALRGVDSAAESTKRRFNEITQEQLRGRAVTDDLTSSFNRLTPAVAAYFSFSTAKAFVSELVNVRGEFQKTEIALKTMLGSEEKANGLMSQAIELAAKTPFEFKDVSNGVKQLLAFQVPAEEVIDTLTRMGNIASGLGVPLDRLQLVFGQVRAKGKLMGDDLRQFTEAGVPMVAELAKKFGESESAIYEMVSAGKIGFNDVKDVLWKMTNQGGMFFNLMEEQSKTVAGQVSNLQDAVTQMFNEMGKSSENFLSSGISGIAYLVENYKSVLDVLGGIIALYGSYRAAIMLVAAVETARYSMMTREIELLSFSEKMKLGRLLVTERQAAATLLETQAELAGIQAKHAAAAAEGTVAGRTQASILAKQVKVAALKVEQAQEVLSVATKNASAAAETRLTVAKTLGAAASRLWASAQAMLNATMLSNPIVLIIAAIGGLVYAYLQLRDTTTQAEKVEQKLKQQRENHVKVLDDLKQKTNDYLNVIRDSNATNLQQYQQYERLQKLYPALLKNIDLETFKKMELVKVNKLLAQAQDQKESELLTEKIEKSTQKILELQKALESLRSRGGYGEGIAKEIQQREEALKLEQDVLKQNNVQLQKRNIDEKIANMTLDERKVYYERIAAAAQRSLDQKKEMNGKLKEGNALASKTRDYFASWSINNTLAQLNLAQSKIQSINAALGDANKPKTARTKGDWEQAKKTAEDAINNMAGGKNNASAKEHLKIIAEANVALQAYDYSNKTAIATEKKAASEATKAAGERSRSADQLKNKQRDALKEIADAERALEKERMGREMREVANIEDKYSRLRERAKEAKLGGADIGRIDQMEKSEKEQYTYEQDTAALLKSLENQKDLYAAYESFKTNIAKTEFATRNGIQLEEFGTFSDIIDAEIRKMNEKGKLTAQEAERLKSLQTLKTETETDKGNKGTQDLDKAIQDTITYQETVEAIEKDFAERRKLIDAKTSGEIRTQKLAMLDQQKSDALNAANQEAIQKTEIFRQLNDRMLQETEQELQARIAALKKMLQDPSLNPEHKAKIEKGLSDAEKLKGNSEEQTRINQLIERRRLLEEAAGLMVDKTSQAYLDAKQSVELLNKEIERSQKAKPFAQTAQWASMISSSFGDLANSIGDSNEGLADTIGTIGEVAGAVADVAGGIAESIMSGNPIAAIGGIIKGISKIFAIGKAARESEKKAQEELKKRQEEQLQAQLDYNATLRQRMIDETKINDLYKSRVDNIKEEMEARSKAMVKNLKDQQMLFNRLLNMTTTVGQYTEKYGGFLGIGKKTRVVDIQKTIGSLLGIAGSKSPFVSIFDRSPFLKKLMNGNNPFKNLIPPDTVTITDEMFENLERLNSQQPLTGDAKNAYEQLKKLRDEYGSFEEANRQLEIQLKNAITGTTAQSLADSIREGLKSGKKSFADFANDIEGFLREAILAGISAKMIEPKIQELQDALADMMGDGILSAEERAQFQEMYMAIVSQSQEYMDIVNQAGVNLTTGSSSVNSLQGAIKGASQESIDILSGHTAAMKLTQFETNTILKNGFAQQLEQSSNMIRLQMEIEKNTRRTADNTEKIHDVNDNVVKVVNGQDKHFKALQAAGIIK